MVSERPFAIASIAGRISIADTINRTPSLNLLLTGDLVISNEYFGGNSEFNKMEERD